MVKKLKSFWSQYNFIVIFLGIFLIYLAINGSQTTWTSVTNIFLHSAILGTIALGMGMIILTGDIDLSVGSSFVLAGGLTILFFNKVNSIFQWNFGRKIQNAGIYCDTGNDVDLSVDFTVYDE